MLISLCLLSLRRKLRVGRNLMCLGMFIRKVPQQRIVLSLPKWMRHLQQCYQLHLMHFWIILEPCWWMWIIMSFEDLPQQRYSILLIMSFRLLQLLGT
jgi:hypothetical protein